VESMDKDIWITALYEKHYIFLKNLKKHKGIFSRDELFSIKNIIKVFILP